MASNPTIELVIFQPILFAQNGGWGNTLKNIRHLKDTLWGDKIDSRLTKGPHGEIGLEVHASFEQIVKVLKQYYYFGLLANNPIDHPGGMEFRDYSAPGFHFKLEYPKREVIGYGYKTGISTTFGGNQPMSWITDFHGDRYNPNYSVYHLIRHFTDFSYLSQMSYNTAGQLTSLILGSGAVDTFTYDPQRLQLASQTAVKGASTLLSLQYSYEAAAGQSGAGTQPGNSGQLMSISGTVSGASRNQGFTYDDLGRLVTATGTGASLGTWQRRYSFDRWSNRTGVWDATSGGNQIQSIVLQQAGGVPTNRITSVTTNGVPAAYGYDSNGNLRNDGAHAYRYDAENRLVKVDDGINGTYGYDTANWRVKKEVGYTTYCIWEGGQVIAEYSDGPPSGSGGLKYYEADRLSTRLVTSSTGAVLGTQDHLPFGDEAGVAGESEKHRFTNYERDGESGTDYAVNRQYGMNAGRYFQTDRLPGSASNPQSWNRYAYSLNDPVNLTDPLGLNVSADEGYDCTCTRHHYSNPATGEGYWGAWSCSCTPSGGGGGGGGGRSVGDTKVVSNTINLCTSAASFAEFSSVSGGYWKGANGNWYRLGWGGNQYAGARSLATGAADLSRFLGRTAFYVGAGLSLYEGGRALKNKEFGKAGKSAVDIGMGAVGAFGGPPGALLSGGYFAVEVTVGWPSVYETAKKTAPSQCTSQLWLVLLR